MISPQRLLKLNPRHRMRKVAAALADAERAAPSSGGEGRGRPWSGPLAALVAALLDAGDSGLGAGLLGAGRAFLAEGAGLRELNGLRHALLAELGAPPAEWDLIMRDRLDPSGRLDPLARRAFPGMEVYLEDIRSPFNLGSMFRSAEALGAARLWLSPGCADPAHPRAQRSSMGAVDVLPWKRLDDAGAAALLAGHPGAFALETGGRPLDEFDFPERGLCLVGSEELGLSPEALEACADRRVSIPMRGAKASLNVGVAFGILMNAWAARVGRRAEGR